MKYHLNQLVIELTRRCNLSCAHCLRGTSQNCNIDTKYIDSLFEKVNSIGSLTLTGGEPSLVPELIEYVTNKAKENSITIGSFYIATNCVNVLDAFIIAVMNLYLYCEEKDSCSLSISNDGYHIDENINTENYEKLEVFKFTNKRESKDGEYYNDRVIDQGNGINFNSRKLTIDVFEFYNDDNKYIDGTVYLNCKGNILCGCDFSYETQDHEIMIVSSVDKFSFNKCKLYNKRIEKIAKGSRSREVNYMIEYYDNYINVIEPEAA